MTNTKAVAAFFATCQRPVQGAWMHSRCSRNDIGVRREDVRHVATSPHEEGHVDAKRMKLTLSGFAIAASIRCMLAPARAIPIPPPSQLHVALRGRTDRIDGIAPREGGQFLALDRRHMQVAAKRCPHGARLSGFRRCHARGDVFPVVRRSETRRHHPSGDERDANKQAGLVVPVDVRWATLVELVRRDGRGSSSARRRQLLRRAAALMATSCAPSLRRQDVAPTRCAVPDRR